MVPFSVFKSDRLNVRLPEHIGRAGIATGFGIAPTKLGRSKATASSSLRSLLTPRFRGSPQADKSDPLGRPLIAGFFGSNSEFANSSKTLF